MSEEEMNALPGETIFGDENDAFVSIGDDGNARAGLMSPTQKVGVSRLRGIFMVVSAHETSEKWYGRWVLLGTPYGGTYDTGVTGPFLRARDASEAAGRACAEAAMACIDRQKRERGL